MKRKKNDDNRKPVTLTTRRVTTQKSNHLIQTKNRVLSSKRTASEKLTDHHQRHQSDSHKHFTSLPVAATSLWQENLAV